MQHFTRHGLHWLCIGVNTDRPILVTFSTRHDPHPSILREEIAIHPHRLLLLGCQRMEWGLVQYVLYITRIERERG